MNFWSTIKLRSQGAIEEFNKTIQSAVEKAFYHLKDEVKKKTIFILLCNSLNHSTIKMVHEKYSNTKKIQGFGRNTMKISLKKLKQNRIKSI